MPRRERVRKNVLFQSGNIYWNHSAIVPSIDKKKSFYCILLLIGAECMFFLL